MNDGRDGLSIKYDPDGLPGYAIRYSDDIAISYTYSGRDGKWVPEIKMTAGLFTVHTSYSNGNPSRHCAFKDGKINGIDTLFYSNGKIRSIDSNSYGLNEGRKVLYTPGGQLNFESTSLNDKMNGVVREYLDNGKLAKETPYYNGIIHGIEKIYDESMHLTENRFYYYGKLLAVKK